MSNEQITENDSSPVEQETLLNTNTSTETTTPTEEATISSTTNNTVQTSKSWKEIISKEYRSNPNIEKFTEIDALAKSYINAVSMIGSDKIPVPTNNSTDEQWNEIYTKLGRPESPDKYKLDVKSDVVPIEETAVKSFAENAHKLGLNNKQAQGILEFYKNNMEQSAQQQSINTETAQADAEAQLRKEWGRSFDENIKRAGSLAKANMSPELLDMQMKDGTRLGDHPEIIKGFANIANLISEDKIIGTEQENMSQGRDLETEISTIVNDRNGPYWNRNHPDHDKVVQQVLTLRNMMNG